LGDYVVKEKINTIKDIVHQVIGKISVNKPEQEQKIERMWKNILEKAELKHTYLNGIKVISSLNDDFNFFSILATLLPSVATI